ncbi:sulfite exporter TauE/SafE family protein [Rhodoferax sp. OV413]|uniref:sulfite exporter TauE/SafE family protein n=1 Tax=Rhodoferax sp. OV413 TaxID=1855285 RepID=UPI0025D2D37C|nr:sulfite exporter TauE/SafE family protein [Rhodoferax sp. OV413]
MSVEPLLIVELATLGLVTGLVAGLLGIGGGMIMGPFLTYILTARGVSADVAVKMAIATSMATIMFTSISSLRAHHQRGAVRWDVARSLSPGIVLGGALASLGVFALIKGSVLAMLFAVFISYSATQIFLDKKPRPGRVMPGRAGQWAAGGLIGFLSGLVGAGGAFVSVPFMVAHNIPLLNAVATSAALGLPIALANTAGYVWAGQWLGGLPPWSLGYVWLPGLAVIAACSVCTAPVGARMAHSLPIATLRRVFACVLYVLAAYMFWKGLHG